MKIEFVPITIDELLQAVDDIVSITSAEMLRILRLEAIHIYGPDTYRFVIIYTDTSTGLSCMLTHDLLMDMGHAFMEQWNRATDLCNKENT